MASRDDEERDGRDDVIMHRVPDGLAVFDEKSVDVLYGYSVIGASGTPQLKLEDCHHLVIGTSGFTSRYSPHYVARLLGWARERFRRIDIVLPGDDSAFLLMARGMSEKQARERTRHRTRRLVHEIDAALGEHEIQVGYGHVVTFDTFRDNKRYKQLHEATVKKYDTNSHFRDLCLAAALRAVQKRVIIASVDRAKPLIDLDAAVQYVFAEMPFIIDSPGLFSVSHLLVCYYRTWPVFDDLLAGEAFLPIRRRGGFLVVTDLGIEGAVSTIGSALVERGGGFLPPTAS